MASLSGPLNLSGFPLTLGGNVFSTSTIQASQLNAGDTIGYFAGGADKYGFGQYSGSRSRVFTSGTAANASVGWSLATSTLGVFNDLLTANVNSINALVPLFAAAATLSGTLVAPVANLSVINGGQVTCNNAVVSNSFSATVGNVQTFGAGQVTANNATISNVLQATVGTITTLGAGQLTANNATVSNALTATVGTVTTLGAGQLTANNATVSNALTAAVGTVTTLGAGQFTANNATVSNVLTATVENVQTLNAGQLTANNAVVSNALTSAVGTITTFTAGQLTANNATVSNALTSAVATVGALTAGQLTANNATVSNALTATVGNISTLTASTVSTANANVSGFLTGANANITNLVVSGTVSLPPTNTVSANNASFTTFKAATYVEQGGAVAANASSVVLPLTGDTTQIFLKVAALGAAVPAIRMAVSTGNAQTFDVAATNYTTSVLAQANSSITSVTQAGAAYPTLVAGAKGGLATHTVRVNYTGQINDSANGAFTSSLFDLSAAGLVDATAGGGVYLNTGTVVYASNSSALPTYVRFTLENTGNTAGVPSYIRSAYQPISYM